MNEALGHARTHEHKLIEEMPLLKLTLVGPISYVSPWNYIISYLFLSALIQAYTIYGSND